MNAKSAYFDPSIASPNNLDRAIRIGDRHVACEVRCRLSDLVLVHKPFIVVRSAHIPASKLAARDNKLSHRARFLGLKLFVDELQRNPINRMANGYGALFGNR